MRTNLSLSQTSEEPTLVLLIVFFRFESQFYFLIPTHILGLVMVSAKENHFRQGHFRLVLVLK
jgi:hypothetical protein